MWVQYLKIFLNQWLIYRCVFPPSTILSASASLQAWPTIRHPPLAQWRGALSPWAPYQRMETGRSVDWMTKKKNLSSQIETYCNIDKPPSFSNPHPAGERPHPPSNECVHDLQQTPSCSGAPAPPQPGQSDGQQDPGGVVVRAGTQREAAVPRLGLPGEHLSVSYNICWCFHRTAW